MYLQNVIESVLSDLEDVMLQMTDEQYTLQSSRLHSSVGQHVRHIIGLYQALLNGYNNGIVNYDKRERGTAIETDRLAACRAMNNIKELINRPDKAMVLEASFGMQDGKIDIESNFHRELAYNLEHTIHHMALIRVGLNELTEILVPEQFGVAASTLKYRTGCAQ